MSKVSNPSAEVSSESGAMSTPAAKAAYVRDAVEILRVPGGDAKRILKVAKELNKHDEFGYAWRILAKALTLPGIQNEPEYVEIVQRTALATYKDVNLPLEKRLDDALTILTRRAGLTDGDGRITSNDRETLGLAGAIWKRKWEADNRREHLEESFRFYERAYKEEPAKELADRGYTGVNTDQGYAAINAAYVSDMLGYLESKTDPDSDVVRKRRADARAIRERIVAEVPWLIEPPLSDKKPLGKRESNAKFRKDWFFYGTVGEAHFGLGNYDEAIEWLVTKPEEAGAEPSGWEFETTARQLASLARVQIAAEPSGKEFEQETPWLKFQEFLTKSKWAGPGGVSSRAVRRGFEGKTGLALSGGGFRASLFHIGVLARLAELDVLRRVEVISCVSGGSIVGAHYYLEVQNLLRRKRDEEITPQDYVEIVGRVAERFVEGVQRNIRVRVAASFASNLKMVFKPGYTRTLRLGELYEEELYSRVDDRHGVEKKKPRYMHELIIHPLLGERGGVKEFWREFRPKLHNWRRQAKAPILVLNAATLNTGHNWQFTATYMGESPASIHTEIDSVYRLRRKSYTDEPDTQGKPQKVRLGAAVAASSCVPVLFEPVVLEDAYQRSDGGDGGSNYDVSVRLVDGGVCDNQGVASLLEQDCNILLVSDGSGQIEPADTPGTAALAVAGRSNGVLQARIRGTQYRELDARHRSSFLRGLMFVHLKKDLDNSPIDWKGCPPYLTIAPPYDAADLTSYGVPKDVQKRLARIRTDLDTFCDLESFALMTSGYLMTKVGYGEAFGKPPEEAPTANWKFLRVAEVMKNTGNVYREERAYLDRVLDAGSGLAFKVWKLSPGLKTVSRVAVALAAVVALAALALAVWTFPDWRHAAVISPEKLKSAGELLTFGLVVTAFVAVVVAALLVYVAGRVVGVTRWADTLAGKIVSVLLVLLGYPVAKIHLWFFEDRYKKCGSLERVVGPQTTAAAGASQTPQTAD